MSFDLHKQKVVSFYGAHRRMPGYKEIMSMTGFRSKNAVFKFINKLADMGFVSKDSSGHILPSRLLLDVPRLGVVEAGIPTTVDATTVDEMINIDEYLIANKEATFVLEVKGESMIDAGIHEHDLVVVDCKKTPRIGDIVIAEVDGGWTMKYLRIKNGKHYLEPANKNFKNIYPLYDLKIRARVVGVVRKY